MQSNSATAPDRLRAFNTGVVALTVAAIAASAVHASWQGLAAVALGIVGTAVFLAGTWTVVKLMGASATVVRPTSRQAVVMALLLLLKLPLIYLGWVLAQRLGPFGPTWFLLGLALVYCLVIWRAVLAVRD